MTDAATAPADVSAPPALAELRELLAEAGDLATAAELMRWDQEVMMPRGGGDARAAQLATLGRVAHERLTDDRVGELLEELRDYEATLTAGTDEACLIRVARRDFEKARRVPGELVSELAHASASGQQEWEHARPESDFARVEPHLRRNVELRKRYAECFPEADATYDALLDDFEPEMKTAEARDVLARLREGLLPLVEAARARPDAVDPAPLEDGPFAPDAQRSLVRRVLEQLGLNDSDWRLDASAHPFSTSFARRDVRITTRYAEETLDSLFSAMHELGHGLYEHGIDPALERTPLGTGVSMAVHESQSRLWENMVGRSLGFWRWCLPELRAAFPGRYEGASPEDLFRASNVVRPSLIRVEADEVTYGLHIILRLDLELELFENGLEVSELPAAWNERMRSDLGVEVPDHARGVMQDVHWYAGAFGYFPTYALGNVVAGQLWARVNAELPDLDDQLATGRFGDLREWLRDRVHRHGRKHTPAETIELATGAPIDPGPLLAYLREKLDPLYGPLPAG